MFYVSDCSLNICTNAYRFLNGITKLSYDLRARNRLVGSGMFNKEAYRLVSKVEARSWTQPARNLSNDEAYRLGSKEKEKESRTQERKRSEDGARQLERRKKETWRWTQEKKCLTMRFDI